MTMKLVLVSENISKQLMDTVESTEDESGESDREWQDDPLSQSAAAIFSQSSSYLHDSLVEEQETSQPRVLNTVLVTDVCPNRDNRKREETVMVEKFLSNGCGCDLGNGGCSCTFTAESLEANW